MTTTHLSDRMPAVAHGREEWTPTDREHFAGCEDCSTEWKLVQLGSRVGQEIDGNLDLTAVADQVYQRVSEAKRVRTGRFRSVRWFVPLAAAALLLLMLTGRQPPTSDVGEFGMITAVLLPELESLSEEELDLVFDVVPAALNPLEQGIPDVAELDEEDLERLLRTLEG